MAEPIVTPLVVGGAISAFLLWLGKRKFNEIDELDTRVTKIETKLDVLGDISESLQHVRTDVEVIKSKVEHIREDIEPK